MLRGRVVRGKFLLKGPRRDIGRNIFEVAGGDDEGASWHQPVNPGALDSTT